MTEDQLSLFPEHLTHEQKFAAACEKYFVQHQMKFGEFLHAYWDAIGEDAAKAELNEHFGKD
jgi:hypothetical protein